MRSATGCCTAPGRPMTTGGFPADAWEWQRWGSVAGLSPAVLARLATRAVPQPVGTLTQPLRLSTAVSELPRTGVLCTANGSSIAMVEALVGLGDPRFQVLTDPRVSFFELDTGHWPMLSRPDEVAETLMRAAAGEGHRVAAKVNEQPAHLRPFLMEVPERPRERVGRVDLHLPDDLAEADHPRPAVVFVHGGPVHPDVRPTPRDWPGFVGYGQYVAGLGAVGVTLDHRLHDLADYGRAAEDIAEAVDLVRADPRVDGDRVALWCFSSGGLLSADWLAAPPPWLRCVAASYPILAPLPNWGLVDSRFRPADAVRSAGRLPIVLTRVELERAEIAVTVEEFLAAAEKCDADVEVIDVPLGHHGFETIDRTEQARHALERAVRSVLEHLRR
ncbi:alpha/beta fold hydrolase [Streptomyces mirabilis]|nr:alpha/beta fold hydrolase [Streptomyces mirabilis]